MIATASSTVPKSIEHDWVLNKKMLERIGGSKPELGPSEGKSIMIKFEDMNRYKY